MNQIIFHTVPHYWRIQCIVIKQLPCFSPEAAKICVMTKMIPVYVTYNQFVIWVEYNETFSWKPQIGHYCAWRLGFAGSPLNAFACRKYKWGYFPSTTEIKLQEIFLTQLYFKTTIFKMSVMINHYYYDCNFQCIVLFPLPWKIIVKERQDTYI